jgi:AraC-like DNA-binding protein
VAVIDLDALPGYPSAERLLAAFRTQFPNLGVVILLRLDRDPFTLFRLGKAGIENLVPLPTGEMEHGLLRAVAKAGECGATAYVVRALSYLLPRRELRVAFLAMDSVYRRWSAEQMAEQVGLTRPYLSECFRRFGLPSLGHFLLWTKLFHAAHWLQEPGRTGESVGRQLEYSSGAAFRRALKLYTDATPTQVRENGGLRLVFRIFLSRNGLSLPGDPGAPYGSATLQGHPFRSPGVGLS